MRISKLVAKRWFLGGVAVVAAAIAVVMVAPRYYLYFLPRPEVADRESLVRWLVLRDLTREEPETVRVLATRLDEEFGQQETNLDTVREGLKPAYKERLRSNLPVLIMAWFEEKMDRYASLPSEARDQFLDRILDAVDRWRDLAALSQDGNGAEKEKSPGLGLLILDQIARWKSTLAPDRREKADRFLAALQTRWMVRSLFGTSVGA